MKKFLPLAKATVFNFILFFLLMTKSFSQDFVSGVPASSFSATIGNQSAILSWSPASFTFTAQTNAGYLLIYSTSTPSLVNAPDGLTPDFAVLNGTIVETKATVLPNLPANSATANGLTNGTSYYFMIVAYTWDGQHSSSCKYSLPSTICATLSPDQPQNLFFSRDNVTAASVSGSFDPSFFYLTDIS